MTKVARRRIGMVHASLGVLIALLPFSHGCIRQGARISPDALAEGELARSTAYELTRIVTRNDVIEGEEITRLRIYVGEEVSRGRVAGMASLINAPGPWQEALWYKEFADAFASAFRRERAIVMNDAPRALKALRTLATADGFPRNVAVNAGAAIRFECPDVARAVLMRQYAQFQVSDSWVLGKYAAPEPCGEVLVAMGIVVPEELVCVEDVAELLRRGGTRVSPDEETERRRLVSTGNHYNALLRQAMDRGDWALLTWLAARDAQLEKVAEIYRLIILQKVSIRPSLPEQ